MLGRTEHSTGWVHMQSVHACAVQTHFSFVTFFLKKPPKEWKQSPCLSRVLCKLRYFCEKKMRQQMLQKHVPRQMQMNTYSQVKRLPGQQPRVRTVQTRNNIFQQETTFPEFVCVYFSDVVRILESFSPEMLISEAISEKMLFANHLRVAVSCSRLQSL